MIGYMFLGCFVSIYIVFAEIYITYKVKKGTVEETYALLKAQRPELRVNIEQKVIVWATVGKKISRVLVKPNFFLVISKPRLSQPSSTSLSCSSL